MRAQSIKGEVGIEVDFGNSLHLRISLLDNLRVCDNELLRSSVTDCVRCCCVDVVKHVYCPVGSVLLQQLFLTSVHRLMCDVCLSLYRKG